MEAQLARGALLRELLQQERLDPLPIREQLAWLIAFNEGLFDGSAAETLAPKLERLRASAADCPLSLEDDRAAWVKAVRGWLQREPGKTDEPAA